MEHFVVFLEQARCDRADRVLDHGRASSNQGYLLAHLKETDISPSSEPSFENAEGVTLATSPREQVYHQAQPGTSTPNYLNTPSAGHDPSPRSAPTPSLHSEVIAPAAAESTSPSQPQQELSAPVIPEALSQHPEDDLCQREGDPSSHLDSDSQAQHKVLHPPASSVSFPEGSGSDVQFDAIPQLASSA